MKHTIKIITAALTQTGYELMQKECDELLVKLSTLSVNHKFKLQQEAKKEPQPS